MGFNTSSSSSSSNALDPNAVNRYYNAALGAVGAPPGSKGYGGGAPSGLTSFTSIDYGNKGGQQESTIVNNPGGYDDGYGGGSGYTPALSSLAPAISYPSVDTAIDWGNVIDMPSWVDPGQWKDPGAGLSIAPAGYDALQSAIYGSLSNGLGAAKAQDTKQFWGEAAKRGIGNDPAAFKLYSQEVSDPYATQYRTAADQAATQRYQLESTDKNQQNTYNLNRSDQQNTYNLNRAGGENTFNLGKASLSLQEYLAALQNWQAQLNAWVSMLNGSRQSSSSGSSFGFDPINLNYSIGPTSKKVT